MSLLSTRLLASLAHRSDPNLQGGGGGGGGGPRGGAWAPGGAPLGSLDGEPPDDAPHFVGLRCLPPISGHGKPDDELVRLLQSRVAKRPCSGHQNHHRITFCKMPAQSRRGEAKRNLTCCRATSSSASSSFCPRSLRTWCHSNSTSI
jgi:hypothetical protein